MPDKLCNFIREYVTFIFTSLLFTLWIMFLIPGDALQYLTKWNSQAKITCRTEFGLRQNRLGRNEDFAGDRKPIGTGAAQIQ